MQAAVMRMSCILSGGCSTPHTGHSFELGTAGPITHLRVRSLQVRTKYELAFLSLVSLTMRPQRSVVPPFLEVAL